MYKRQDETIYTGRLIDVSHNHETCTLKIQSARPWDFISIPNILTTTANVPVPCAYGEFTPSSASPYDTGITSHELETDYITDLSSTLRPAPLNDVFDGNAFFVSNQSSQATGNRPEYWDSSGQVFIPTQISTFNSALNSNTSHDGQYCARTSQRILRALKVRPTSHTIETDESQSTADLGDAYDTGGSYLTTYSMTHLESESTGSSIGQTQDEFIIKYEDIPSLDGEFVQGKVYVTSELTVGGTNSGSDYSEYSRLEIDVGDGSFTDIFLASGATLYRAKTTDAVDLSDYPSYLKLKMRTQAGNDYPPTKKRNSKFYIFNIFICVEMQTTGDRGEKTCYIGADGYDADYLGGSGAVANIPEAHRDILDRYGNLDEETPDGFATLTNGSSGIREDWKIRYWLTQSTDMRKILERLQFEGCFIFTFKADGSMRYISIPTSPSADWSFDDSDLSNISISHTPFSELQTQYDIRYQKHPAEGKYMSSETYQSGGSDTIRDRWNILTKENIREIKLDALVDDDGGDMQNFADYYFDIFGDIKIIIGGEIVNPAKWGVEVGDIVTFTDLTLKAYNTDLGASDYFMITDLTRSLDSLKFKAREVG